MSKFWTSFDFGQAPFVRSLDIQSSNGRLITEWPFKPNARAIAFGYCYRPHLDVQFAVQSNAIKLN